MSPLRQRMIAAMTVRGMSPRTIECYTESIARLKGLRKTSWPA